MGSNQNIEGVSRRSKNKGMGINVDKDKEIAKCGKEKYGVLGRGAHLERHFGILAFLLSYIPLMLLTPMISYSQPRDVF